MTNLDLRSLFLNHVGQTSEMPLMFEVDRAEGVYIYDSAGKEYMDMNSGISVSLLGHRHPNVIKGIVSQLDRYMHTMVYGEHIQSPQIQYAKLLTDQLPSNLNNIYFLNSGSEAVELAMKLAKRNTGRYEIISCSNAYHGSTQGAEALRSDHGYSRAFMPLQPGIRHIEFNNLTHIEKVSSDTAAVILEPIQAEAGVIIPDADFLIKLREKCNETDTLLILDEIQTGFGRTGHLFAFQKYNCVPDILLIGKGMGGGIPISGVVSSKTIMSSLIKNPALGHITTFGGNPVTTAAALATLNTILDSSLIQTAIEKEQLIHKLLKHNIIKEIRSSGLMMAVELTKRKYLKHVVSACMENGVIVDYFLFNNKSFRLYPPLIINSDEITTGTDKIKRAMDFAEEQYI